MSRLWSLGALALLVLCLQTGPGAARDPLWTLLPWDERLGVHWYENRGERGDTEAQAIAGLLHERGIGTPADPEEALRWYRLAAEGGQPVAQFRLAVLLSRGAVGHPDHQAAARWYQAAAEAGIPQAAFNLALLYETGQGMAPDDAQAAGLYEQAFRGGLGQAALNRALLALRTFPVDAATAYAWLLRAQRAGIAESETLIAQVAPLLTERQREEVEAAARQPLQ